MHPLDKFAYCPACGSSDFRVNNIKSKRCGRCGFTYYANPSAATAAFILRTVTRPGGGGPAEELLVLRRAKEPARGTLDLPGGFVDMDETAEEGMRREIMEETGLEVESMEYLFSCPNVYMYSGMGVHTLDMDYLVRVSGRHDTVTAADDAAEAMWLPLDQVHEEDFGLDSIRRAVGRFLASR